MHCDVKDKVQTTNFTNQECDDEVSGEEDEGVQDASGDSLRLWSVLHGLWALHTGPRASSVQEEALNKRHPLGHHWH